MPLTSEERLQNRKRLRPWLRWQPKFMIMGFSYLCFPLCIIIGITMSIPESIGDWKNQHDTMKKC